jgi:hypothetical protein
VLYKIATITNYVNGRLIIIPTESISFQFYSCPRSTTSLASPNDRSRSGAGTEATRPAGAETPVKCVSRYYYVNFNFDQFQYLSLSLSLSLSHNVQFLAKNVVQKRDLPEIRDAMHSEIGNRRDQDMKFPKSCGFSLTDQHMQKRNSLALGKNSETFPCI